MASRDLFEMMVHATRSQAVAGPRLLHRTVLHILALIVVLSGTQEAFAGSGAKGRLVTLSGSLESVGCEVERHGSVVLYRECGISCQRPGNLVGLLDSNGEFYVLLDPKSGEPQGKVAGRMSQTVSVTGLLVEEPGFTPIIYVRAMK